MDMNNIQPESCRAFHQAWRWQGKPNVSQDIHAAVKEVVYRPFVAKTLSRVPHRFIPSLLAEYNARNANKVANEWLRESIGDAFPQKGLSLTASDDDINNKAKILADNIRDLLASQTITTPERIYEYLQDYCARHDVVFPQCKTLLGAVNRVTNVAWWKRAIRKQIMRKREHGAIKCGFVHRNAGLYVSDDAVELYRQDKKRGLQWIEDMEAMNELDEVLDLKAIAQSNTSCPEKRRLELAIRANGQEQYAIKLDYVSLFLTITAPSAYHSRSGKNSNPKYNGKSPKDTNSYLCGQFSKTRAKLDRENINYFGLRIVEPHHDATPHWHMLVHVEKCQINKLLSIFREYALEHNSNEYGAQKHRFTYEQIDRSKGSAIGYILKYISKNIDGHKVGEDYESDGLDTAATSERVVAWAKRWGIRQFQTFGDCPVTIYRELRKLRVEPECVAIKPHWLAADAGNYGNYIQEMKINPIKLWAEERPSTRYLGETMQVIRGLKVNNELIETRLHRWVLRQKSEAFAPRINVNNCTGIKFDRGKKQDFSNATRPIQRN